MDQNGGPGGTPFSLYLKANGNIYSVVQINTLPTITTAVSVVIALVCGVAADRTGGFWILSVAVTLPVLVGMALLVAWDVGERGRLAGFFLTGFEGGKHLLLSSLSSAQATKIGASTDASFVAISPLTMSWATVIMAGDAEERAVVTASMNALGQAIAAGTQVVQFPATGAPNFQGGFRSALATTVVQFLNIFLILFLSRKYTERQNGAEVGSRSPSGIMEVREEQDRSFV